MDSRRESGTPGFDTLVLKLGTRVRKIEMLERSLSVKELASQLADAENIARNLEVHADYFHIDRMRYYEPLSDIGGRLARLRTILQRREQPWWKKALGVVARVVNFFLNCIGLPALLPSGSCIAGLLDSGDD